MEQKETNRNFVFLIAKRRLVRENDKSFSFATTRGQNCHYFNIHKPGMEKSGTVSMESDIIRVNEHGASRAAYRVEIRRWFARLLDMDRIEGMMSKTDIKILER